MIHIYVISSVLLLQTKQNPHSYRMHENLFVKYIPRKMIHAFVILIDTAKLSYIGNISISTSNRNKWINSFPTALPMHSGIKLFIFAYRWEKWCFSAVLVCL